MCAWQTSLSGHRSGAMRATPDVALRPVAVDLPVRDVSPIGKANRISETLAKGRWWAAPKERPHIIGARPCRRDAATIGPRAARYAAACVRFNASHAASGTAR